MKRADRLFETALPLLANGSYDLEIRIEDSVGHVTTVRSNRRSPLAGCAHTLGGIEWDANPRTWFWTRSSRCQSVSPFTFGARGDSFGWPSAHPHHDRSHEVPHEITHQVGKFCPRSLLLIR